MAKEVEEEKQELIEFLIEIQKTVLNQGKSIKDTNFKINKNQREYFLFLIEILENFNHLYTMISSRKDQFDQGSLRIFRSFDMIRKKISNYLESHDVRKIDLEGKKVEIGLCEVMDSEEVDDPNLKGKVKSVVSYGYTHLGEVIKGARVITYR